MPATAYTWATSLFFRCASRRLVHPPLTRPRLSYCASPHRVVGSRWQNAATVLPVPLARRSPLPLAPPCNRQRPFFRCRRDRRQATPATSPATRAAKQLASCSKCGADRNNLVLSRRSWTRAKKRSVKGARSLWTMIRRLNPMRDKNRIAAAKQVNDSHVRHFSRATNFSNAFQNVRWFRRRELRKYSPGGDNIFVPIFAG